MVQLSVDIIGVVVVVVQLFKPFMVTEVVVDLVEVLMVHKIKAQQEL